MKERISHEELLRVLDYNPQVAKQTHEVLFNGG